jgi:GntR family transcriptional regulator/MocR family aminotransferase
VLDRAARHSVLFEPLSRCWLSEGPHPAGIVVGYATPADSAFGPALRALLEVLNGYS